MAGPTDNSFLVDAAIYLGATAVAVPVFKRLQLGTILGFLAAGVALGPSALGILSREEGAFQIAELGIVLFLFVIGLELSVPRLWSMRDKIFGLGLSQMTITGLIIAPILIMLTGLGWGPGMVAGFALACSSTAFALSLMQERRELNTPHGTRAFSILLLQDVAVIPLLASIPIVAAQMQGDGSMPIQWDAIFKAVGVILAIVLIGRYALNWVLKIIAISGSREAFTAAALFVVAAVSLGVAEVGLSMALGAFLAGVLLSESAFRHQIESDIEPFRELLLGLFFIGVGVQLDLGVVAEAWWQILAGAAALMAGKMAIIVFLTRMFKADMMTSLRTGATLSQGGEFGFVVFSLGVGAGLFQSELATILSAMITISMVATPLLIMAVNRLSFAKPVGDLTSAADAENKGRVLIVGFGRIGQIVDQVLQNSGVEVTAIDSDPRRIELAARFGNRVYFGDGTDVNLLVQAGATKVDAIVLALDIGDRLKPLVAGLRERCPKVRILARVRDRSHELEMLDSDADYLVREMLDGSMNLAEKTLDFLGFAPGLIEEISEEFRERDRDRLLAQKAEGVYARKEDLKKPFEALAKGTDTPAE